MTRPQGDPSDRWVLHGERPVYQAQWLTVGLADVSLPTGDRIEHHTVELRAAAMVVVLDEGGARVLLAWRHRWVADAWNWELPGGLIDDGETPVAAAAREVEEETGYRPRTIEHLVTFEPMIGMVRSPHHVYLVWQAGQVAAPTERNEGTFEWIPLANVPEMIRQGQIANSGSLIGLLHVLAFR